MLENRPSLNSWQNVDKYSQLPLKEEGASLQQLKDEVRCERAKDLLFRSGKPVKQVAAAAGFRNEKSFIRAFRQWTGVTPAEFRRVPQE
jgi:AraC-like DNA-binding protein